VSSAPPHAEAGRFVVGGPRDSSCPSSPWLPERELVALASGFARAEAALGLREVNLARTPSFDLVGAPGAPRVRVHLALECFQVTGSFKVRGALFALREARRRTPGLSRVVAASAGNHGAGVAFAAKALGLTATLFVPRGAPEAKLAKMRAYGAEPRLADSIHYDGAETEAMAYAAAEGVPFVSPYDDPDVLVGNGASLAFEIARALGAPPAAVVAPIGGGGLATGLALGLAVAAGVPYGEGPPVLAAQSEASCAFALSLERGRAITTLEGPPTLAEGLEGGISERGFARARAVCAGALVVSEAAIEAAMYALYTHLGLVVEGSAAVGVAALATQAGQAALARAGAGSDADVVVVVTGRNVDAARAAKVVLRQPVR